MTDIKNIKLLVADKHIIESIIMNIKQQKLEKFFDFTYKTQKYNLPRMLAIIIDVIKCSKPWRRVTEINHNTVYKLYRKLIRFKLLTDTYYNLLGKYLENNPIDKLKILITDTTFITNKCGSEDVSYNGHKKRKGTKLSLVGTVDKIVLSPLIADGAEPDSTIFLKHIKDKKLVKILEKYITNNLNEENFLLADSGYDTKDNSDAIKEKHYKPLIWFNKRNTKDVKKMRKFNAEQQELYKKRTKIEHTNGLIKSTRRLNVRYDRNKNTLYGSVYMALIDLIIKQTYEKQNFNAVVTISNSLKLDVLNKK